MAVSNRIIKTDVLVIGSGIAGCFAAMRAKELGADVVMVEQGKSGFAGMSVGGTHRLRIVLPDDDFDAAMQGSVMECEYMVDQEFLEGALRETWERFQELLRLGAEFRRNDSGQILWQFADTFFPHFKQRNVLWQPIGTYKHILKINQEVIRLGVKVLDRILITDLLTSDGKVQGACGFHTRKGDFYLFKAKAVVMASGGFSGGGLSFWPSLTGDGIAMGIKAGAELRGMEFGKAETLGMPPVRGASPWVYTLFPQEEEVAITNARGEEFLEQYEFGRRLPGRRYCGPPWRIQGTAMLKELKEGRGPCYVDYRVPNKSGRLREFWGSFFDRTLKQLAFSGSSLEQIKCEIAIASGYNLGGGIRITPQSESSLPGFYAGGQTSDMCGVVQYCIISGMMASLITGGRAGASAAKYTLTQPEPVILKREAERMKNEIYAPLGRKRGVISDEMLMNTKKAWVNIDIRNENTLRKAHEDLQSLRKDMLGLKAEDYHELVKCHKIRNYLECSDAVAIAARARKETRLEHMREDFPLTDNREWVKWIIVRRTGDELQASIEDVPINRWNVRPEPVVVDRLRPTEERKHDQRD